MKNILSIVLLFVAVASSDAATIMRAYFSATNNPSDGHSMTFNGSTRTFKNTVTSAITQIQIGATVADTANNIASHLGLTPFTSSILAQTEVTNITIIANAGVAVTASVSGAWGTVATYTNPGTSTAFMVPQSAEPSPVRVTNVNNLLSSFAYATAQLPAASPGLANFVNLSAAQTISGAKIFSSQTTISNAAAMFTLGYVSNVTARILKLPYSATYSSVGVQFQDNTDTVQWIVTPGSDGHPTIRSPGGSGANYAPNGADILTRSIADNYFGRLGLDNTWTGINTFSSFTGSGTGVTLTNSIGGFTDLWATSISVAGNLGFTNSGVTISLYDSGGATDKKMTKLIADDDAFAVKFYTDAGGVDSVPLNITRSLFEIDMPTSFLQGVSAQGANVTSTLDIYTGGIIAAGDDTPTLPASLTKGFASFDGVAPSADPTTGFVLWTDAGTPKYRGSGEATGGSYYVHNRTSTTQGAGTDYSLTSSTAAIDFGTTDPVITAPTSGTYLIFGSVSITAGASAGDDYRFKLRNTTAGSDISGTDHLITNLAVTPAPEQTEVSFQHVATLTAADSVTIYAHNNTAARGTVNSARTRIGYIRLY